MARGQLQHGDPVLTALDVRADVAFWTSLGFAVGYEDDDFATLTRDGVDLFICHRQAGGSLPTGPERAPGVAPGQAAMSRSSFEPEHLLGFREGLRDKPNCFAQYDDQEATVERPVPSASGSAAL